MIGNMLLWVCIMGPWALGVAWAFNCAYDRYCNWKHQRARNAFYSQPHFDGEIAVEYRNARRFWLWRN